MARLCALVFPLGHHLHSEAFWSPARWLSYDVQYCTQHRYAWTRGYVGTLLALHASVATVNEFINSYIACSARHDHIGCTAAGVAPQSSLARNHYPCMQLHQCCPLVLLSCFAMHGCSEYLHGIVCRTRCYVLTVDTLVSYDAGFRTYNP